MGAVLYNVLFGLAYLPLKVSTNQLEGDTVLLIASRYLFCFLALKILKQTGHIHFRSFRAIAPFALPLCVVQLLSGFFEASGMRFFPSGKSSIIMALIPLITTLLAIFIFREIPSWGQVIFILIGFGGVVVAAGNKEDEQATALGLLLILLAAIMSSVLNLYIRKLDGLLSPWEITYAMACAMLLVYGPTAVVQHGIRGTWNSLFTPLTDPLMIGCLLYLAVGSSLYAAALRNVVFANMPMAAASSFSGLSTVTAVAAGALLLGEAFGPREAVGFVLVVLGVTGVNLLGHYHTVCGSGHTQTPPVLFPYSHNDKYK